MRILRTLEDYKAELEGDAEFQSLYKRIKTATLNPFDYTHEMRDFKGQITRYSEEGYAHFHQMLDFNEELEGQLARLRNTAYYSVYARLDSSCQSLYNSAIETIKAHNRAALLSYELNISADAALALGMGRGWEKHVETEIRREFAELKAAFARLNSKLGDRYG